MEELCQDLRAVTKKRRPDWDIKTSKLRAAWQQGRKEFLYPYGKTYVQTMVIRIKGSITAGNQSSLSLL